MGVIADSMVEYARPLIDESDGSDKQVQSALLIAQMCWTLALVSGSELKKMLAEIRPGFMMDDNEFADFCESVVFPMILRHHEMFPNMPSFGELPDTEASPSRALYPGTGRNEPCPCGSGKKYKRCCGG